MGHGTTTECNKHPETLVFAWAGSRWPTFRGPTEFYVRRVYLPGPAVKEYLEATVEEWRTFLGAPLTKRRMRIYIYNHDYNCARSSVRHSGMEPTAHHR